MLTAITGINWGDEGKGRMVDLISQEYDIVARYQGGNNAGHTVKNERGKFVLNLLPSGILRPNVVCVMGNGMVIDPHHLDGEINKLREQGIKITPENLKISDRATITMPYHVEQDGLEEARLSKTGAQFGSTKRGIAYAYGDKYMKKTLRMGDLLHLDDAVKKRLVTMVDSKNLVMEGSYNASPISVDEMWNWLEKYAAIFKDYICDVGQYLADELAALGLEGAHLDDKGYVYAVLPATPGCDAPALGLIAHMDTADDASGENVQPVVWENYNGGDVTLPATGMVMKVSTFPFLADLKGETLITTDGTTLLGADDKAGVAEILTAAELLLAEGRPHGRLCIAFTPDEEIGEGASLFDIPGFGADFAYTVDGGDVGGIEYENFNAAAATVTIHGFSVHPGSAKDAMINASNVAMEFHTALPIMARPETTEGRQGFYHLCQMYGDVTNAKLGYILRDHDADKLQYKKDNLLHIADYLNGKYGPGTVEVEIKDSYRNMLEKIKPHFHLVENARKAIEKAGLTPKEVPVRGGTDGATLSWKGLPCPNLGTGGFNFHGVCECTTVERMDKATEILLNIVELYSK